MLADKLNLVKKNIEEACDTACLLYTSDAADEL